MAHLKQDIHIHLAAIAPHFMDVRTTLPITQLAGMPGVRATLSYHQIELPRLPTEQRKVVVVQRLGVTDSAAYKAAIRTIVRRGWIVVAELDDHPDLVNAIHGRPPNEAVWHSIRLSHAVQTSTPELGDVFRIQNPKIASFPNAAFRLGTPPSSRDRGDKVRIFFGALNREAFSSRVGAILASRAARNPDVEFVVVHDRAFFEALGPGNKTFHPALPYADYLSLMETCDIALMPLEGSPGEAYKSDVKFVEASSLGLATLASAVVYGRTILDGVTGLIVHDVEGWPDAIEQLVFQPERRLRIATAAYDYVARHRLFSTQVGSRLAWYHHLWDERIALTRSLSTRFHSLA